MTGVAIGRRALDVFGAALELPAPARHRWITRRCARDPELRAAAEALLTASTHPLGILDRGTPLLATTAAFVDRIQPALQGQYRLVRALGRGGMATVFLAHEPAHARDVVLKVMHPGLNDAVRSAQFRREISITAALLHPHIVPILDTGTADGLPFYTMPWQHGESLRALLQRPIRATTGFAILRGVSAALAFAHDAGIVHRDVKPENVLVIRDRAMLIDFGIACQSGTPLADAPVRAAGTVGYMAPERADAGSMIDARGDIYALGVLGTELLHRMAAGLKGRRAQARELTALLDACRDESPAARPGDVATVLRWLEDAEGCWQSRDAA
jgi:serine/threonine protein kinase